MRDRLPIDRLALLAACLVAVSACAFVDQKATLRPDVSVAPAAIDSGMGGGHVVAVHVVDERPRSLIGRRGAGGSVGGSITTDQDVAELVREKIIDALQRDGFAPTRDGAGGDRKLNVEVRFLEYELAMGFWTGSVNTRAALKAACRNGDATYERLYRGEHKRGAFVVPSASTNERLLNVALSEALGGLLGDRELLACLAR
jgi:hypothetical protein